VDAIEGQTQTLSLETDISWNGELKPESAYARGSFRNVNIASLGEGGDLVVWVESVNGIDAETAAMGGYIEIIPDGRRTAAVGRQIAGRESWRKYWSDTSRLNSLGAAVGTAFFQTPAFLVSAKMTFSPLPHGFLEIGSDVGLVHGEWGVRDVEYLSIAPYLHYNLFSGNYSVEDNLYAGAYLGVGGGASFSWYTYPSESRVDPVTVITPVFDVNLGMIWMFSHSLIDLRWTGKTNFITGFDHRVSLGYSYRFGYVAKRYGGEPSILTDRRQR
jgi:hypothetical protein